MKVIEYMKYVSEVLPRDAVIVSSHTDNTAALISLKLTERSFLGFNMGFATSVGLGLAVALPHRKVLILEADGGVLLSSGALMDLASQNPPNVIVVVADNESSLGFPTHTARKTDIAALAKAAGIERTCSVGNLEEFKTEFSRAMAQNDLRYIVAKTEKTRVPLPRGVKRPLLWENKFSFVRYIEESEGISILTSGGG